MIEYMPIEYLEPNPFQYRQFTDEDLEDLVESIREHGFIGHLEARPARPSPKDPTLSEGKYQLVDGARRLAAAKRAGLTKLPIKRVWRDDTEMEILCYLTNSTIAPPSYWEEAQYFKRLQDHGWSIRQIARAVHKSPGYIQRRLDVLRNTDEEIITAAREGKIDLAAAAMFPYLEPQQRKELFEKLKEGIITATDMRAFHRVMPHLRDDNTYGYTVVITDTDNHPTGKLIPEVNETKHHPHKNALETPSVSAAKRTAQQGVTTQPSPSDHTSSSPEGRYIVDRTVLHHKTPAEHAELLVVQLRAVVENLEDRLSRADISTLSPERLRELRTLAQRLRAFAVRLL